MSTSVALSRPTHLSGRVLARLGVLAVALAAAFVVAPRLLAGWPGGGFADQRSISEALRPGFVEYWRSDDRDLPSHLQAMVDYWSRYHVIKTVTATLLLIVLVALGFGLWRMFLKAGARSARTRVALASGAVTITGLGVFSVVLVMANLQGALAPLSSLLTLMEGSPPQGELVGTLDQVRQHLVDYPRSGQGSPPALVVMVSDFAWYHSVMAVTAAVLALTFTGLSAMSWTIRSRTAPCEPRARRVLASFGMLSAMLALAVILLAVANTTVAANPAPALLAYYRGGW